MSTAINLIISIAAIAGIASAHAQQAAADVTKQQVAKYQSDMAAACQRRGLERGDQPKFVKRFCACVEKTLSEGVPKEEWQRAYLHSVKGNRDAEMAAMAPYLQKIEECKTR